MQITSQDATSGMAIQRVFVRSRYEAGFLQEAYDLLIGLSQRRATQATMAKDGRGRQEMWTNALMEEETKNERHQTNSRVCSCVV